MIVIYGASGYTGSLIAEALHAQELEFAMAGRDLQRLTAAADALCDDVRCAQSNDHDALLKIFEDADVVINCAGPFGLIGEGVVKAALEADCHYIDTTGEQDFVKTIYERYESAARQAGRVIVNACAFEVALGDWAANAAAVSSPPILRRPGVNKPGSSKASSDMEFSPWISAATAFR